MPKGVLCWVWVFPAYAGVNLTYYSDMVYFMRIPRVCGGEPKVHMDARARTVYSPRMRG